MMIVDVLSRNKFNINIFFSQMINNLKLNIPCRFFPYTKKIDVDKEIINNGYLEKNFII